MCASKNPKRSSKGLGLYAGARIKDALDQKSLDYIEAQSFEGKMPHILELGGGSGTHAVRMAQMGGQVTMIDINDEALDLFERVFLHGLVDRSQIKLIKKPWLELKNKDILQAIELLYSQRALSYLSYSQVQKLFEFLSSHMQEGAPFFLSFNGIDSLYGKDHPLRDLAIEERFGLTSPKMQEVLNVRVPICVYAEPDIEKLFAKTSYKIEDIQKTKFGNFQVSGYYKPS